jgi:hypothetical protein
MAETQEVLSSKKLSVSPRLLKGLDEVQEKEFTESYKRARRVLTKINDYARKEADAKLANIESPKAFEIANWSHYVAWNSGYRQAMRIMQDLTRYERK